MPRRPLARAYASLRGYALLAPSLAILLLGLTLLGRGDYASGATLAALGPLSVGVLALGLLWRAQRSLKSLAIRRPSRSDELQLEKLGQAWLQQLTGQELRLLLVDSPVLNALTLRVGPRYVLMTTPCLKDPQVAMAILAHEVGHAAPEARPRRLVVWSSWALDFAVLIAVVTLTPGWGVWQAFLLVGVAYLANFVSKGLLICPELRRSEYAADRVGARLVGPDVMHRLLDWQARGQQEAPVPSWRKRFHGQHPPSDLRAQAVAALRA